MAIPREVKVGAFVLAGLLCIGVIIFLIGDDKQMFSERVHYKTAFGDVQGLKRGSSVRMGGINVGTVEELGYGPNPKDTAIYVEISIVEREAPRIRTDTVATITGKGLLGDKNLDLSVGSPSKPPLKAGGVIQAEEPQDFTQMLDSLNRVSTKVEKVVGHLEVATQGIANDNFQKDVQQAVGSLSNILKSVDEGDGYAKRFLNDPEEAERLSRVVQNLDETTRELNRAARGISVLVERINTGPGFAHDLVYEDNAGKALAQFGGAADEIGTTLRGIREGNGMAKSILYGGDESDQMVANLNAASTDLRSIVADLRAGKGTLGALLVDPSVYEDVKLLLGNVDRNKTLRALVRYSIKRDEAAPNVGVKDSQPAGASVASSADGD